MSAVYHREQFASGALDVFLELISGPIGQSSFFQHQVAHYDHKHTSEIAHRLSELSAMPVQIVWGENDAWQLVEWAHKLHAAIPGIIKWRGEIICSKWPLVYTLNDCRGQLFSILGSSTFCESL